MKKYFLIFLSILFTFTSCSNMGQNNKGSVTFRITPEVMQKLSEKSALNGGRALISKMEAARAEETDTSNFKDGYTVVLSVKGDFEKAERKFIPFDKNLSEEEISVDEIPVGINVYVEIDIYELEEKLFTGKSDSILVINGDNPITIQLSYINQEKTKELYVSESGSDEEGDGSKDNPFASINKANEYITETNKDKYSYIIYINGTIRGSQTINTEKAADIVLTAKESNIAVLDGGFTNDNKGTTLTVSTKTSVGIEKVKITGGYTDDCGAGVKINEGAFVVINEGTLITGNIAENQQTGKGAGIYNKGTLTIYNGSISENTADCFGAGIANEYPGTLYLYDGSISNNECTNELPDLGGAVANSGNFYMNGGEIRENRSNGAGGIYNFKNGNNKAIFVMTDGSISKNTGNCGGLYCAFGAYAEIAGVISDNISTSNGGAILAVSGSSVKITGGTISNNTATEQGGAIYINDTESLVEISGGQISANTAKIGKAISINAGTLKLSGNPEFDTTDDIYFSTLSYITIAGKISSKTPINLSIPAYQEGLKILEIEETSAESVTYEELSSSFNIADNDSSDNTIWKIGNTGCLEKRIKANANIYVSSEGNDTEGDGSEGNPVASITKAASLMDDEDTDYTIYVSGLLSELQKVSDPDENTVLKGLSLTITGANNPDEDGNPVDGINRNKASSANAVSNGNAIEIDTTIPVTITNLLITEGYGSSTKAGGLTIAQGSTVSLGNNVLIIKNRAGSNSRGGAVHNEGTLYMYGSAVIGDKTQKRNALDSSTDSKFTNTSNWASQGGGIFNGSSSDNTVKAKLYLGYKFEDGKRTESELTGGLYYNSGTGGALYNAAGSEVYYNSGIMAWNGTEGGGAAIHNAGYVLMTGGEICFNRALGTNAAYGGGVYNHDQYSVFEMAGGTINHNLAYRSNSYGDTSYGGGIYNNGQFYMYGTAVIGDKNASQNATSDPDNESEVKANISAWGNKAQHGAAIYNNVNTASGQNGGIFIGYRRATDGNPVEETLTGGIYYNYSSFTTDSTSVSSQYGGGAIEATGLLKIASGTIAYNTTEGYGGAIRYSPSASNSFEISGGLIENNKAALGGGAIFIASTANKAMLKLSGDVLIPAGDDGKQDIYIYGSSSGYYASILITGTLSSDFNAQITPGYYGAGFKYISVDSDADTTIENEYNKFTLTQKDNETSWSIGSDGALVDESSYTGVISITMESYSPSETLELTVSGTTITATEGFDEYSWTLNGRTIETTTTNTYDLADECTNLENYNLTVAAKKDNEWVTSATAKIRIAGYAD